MAPPGLDFIAEARRVILAWEVGLLVNKQVSRNFFALLLQVLRAMIREGRWNLSNLLKFSHLLVQCRDYLGIFSVELHDFDCSIRALLWRWASSCLTRAYPRPYEHIPIVDFRLVNELVAEWQGITRVVVDTMPKDEYVPRSQWLEMVCSVYSAQLSMALLERFTSTLEASYLEHEPHQLVSRCMAICGSFLLRSILRTFSLRMIMSSSALSCALLRAYNDGAMAEFLKLVQQDHSFIRIFHSDNVLEYRSRPHMDSSRWCRFQHAFCNNWGEFPDEVVVTCFVAQGEPVPEVLGNFPTFAFPVNHVLISTRNHQVKSRMISKFSQYLDLLDPAISARPFPHSPTVSSQDIELSLEVFIHIWFFIQLHREGICRVSPLLTSKLANFICESVLQILLAPKPITRCVERFLWRGFAKVLELWAEYTCEFYQQKRLTFTGRKFLPIISFVRRILDHCKFSEAYSKTKLLSILDKISSCLENALLAPESHSIDDLKCYQLCVDGCKRILETGISLPPRIATGIKIRSVLGSGTHGTVYKAYSQGLNTIVALKEINLQSGQIVCEDLLEEVRHLRGLDHFHVMRFHDVAVVGPKLFIMTEYCSGGTLLNAIERLRLKTSMVADVLFRKYAIQLLLGLSCLHGHNVIHGDLKPSNILMDDFEQLKLGDFGAARSLVQGTTKSMPGRSRTARLGTIEYMSPETLFKGELTTKSDIWSLGCTLFHLVTGLLPWYGHVWPWGILSKVKAGEIFDLSPLDHTRVDSSAKEMIKSCLRYEPATRPSVFELLLSPFLYEPWKCAPFNADPIW